MVIRQISAKTLIHVEQVNQTAFGTNLKAKKKLHVAIARAQFRIKGHLPED